MNRLRYRDFAAFSSIGTIAMMPLLVLPAMIGVLVDQAGLDDATAGWAASLNFIGSAVAGIVLSLRMHHVDLRRIGTLALTLAVILDLASAWTAGPGAGFLAARFLAGAALGAAYIVSAAAFARYDDYERGYGVFVTLQFIVSGLGLYVVPVFSDELGARGLFFGFAALDVLALALVAHLPDRVPQRSPAGDGKSELHVLLTLAALTGIAGFALFEASNNAQFTYIERFGVAHGLTGHEIGLSLLIASLVGIPGAFMIVILGQRHGTLRPLTLGIGIAVVGLLALIFSESYAWYFFGSCCMGFSWAYCLPYVQSLLASLDRRGSVIAAGMSLSTLGDAFGPGMAATVVGDGRYTNVFLLSIGLFVITYICFVYADRHRGQLRTEAAT